MTAINDLMWWVCENPWRLRVVAYGSMPTAAFLLPLLNGSGIVVALKFAGLQTGVLAVSGLLMFVLRRAGLI